MYIINTVTICISLLIALLALIRGRDRETIVFGFLFIGVAGWLICNDLVRFAPNEEAAESWSRIAYIFTTFIPITLFHFALHLAKLKRNRWFILPFYAIGACLVGFTLFTHQFLSGVNSYSWGYWFKAGPMHPLYVLFFVALLLTSLWLIFNRIKTIESKVDIFVIKRIWLSFLISSLATIDMLPDYGIDVYPMGCVPVVVGAIMLGNTLLFRYTLKNSTIDWVVYKNICRSLLPFISYRNYLGETMRRMGTKAGDQVLVIGVGKLSSETMAEQYGAHATNLDIADIYLQTKNRTPSNDSWLMESLSFEKTGFDKIIIAEWLHLVAPTTAAAILKKCHHLLKPAGGLAVINAYANIRIFSLYRARFKELAAAKGIAAALAFAVVRFIPLLHYFFYTKNVIHRYDMVGLANFISSNALLATMRKNGFTPEVIEQTCLDQLMLCITTVTPPMVKKLPPTPTKKLQDVLSAMRVIVGDEHVLSDALDIAPYSDTTTADARIIDAVIRPSCTEEVQAIVRLANQHKIALYPISTGHNWGYGTASPVHDHNIVLDLGRMNKVHEINQELAYAVIEPGVTQGYLAQFLKENNIPLCVDPTGAGPSCSLLGNALERGFGLGPYADHFLSMCGMDIVLPNGELLRTGFGHYKNSKSTYAYKWGVGPFVDGLFTQSNFGIVTRIGLWLIPKPEYAVLCFFSCKKEDDIAPLIEAIRPLLLSNTMPASVVIVHQVRALTTLRQYPWDLMGGQTPITTAVLQSLAREKKLMTWNGATPLYGTRLQIKATKVAIRKALKGKVVKIDFISPGLIRFLDIFQKPLSILMNLNIPEVVELLKAVYNISMGTPTERSLHAAYWRNTTNVAPPKGLSPSRDKCGIIWFPPIVPATRTDVEKFLSIVRPICAQYKFEACVGFTSINKRVFDCTFPILYDQDNPEETQRAKDCYLALFEQCMEAGYIPYRLGIDQMKLMVNEDDVFWKFVDELKVAIDPNRILSPGRYGKQT